MKARDGNEDRVHAAQGLTPTPGLEGLAKALGVQHDPPVKAPVGPVSTDQPLPGKRTARGRRVAAPKAKPAKKRGRRG